MGAKPRRSERGLVMPPGRRAIPRSPAPRPTRDPGPSPSEVAPAVTKAAGDLLAVAARIRVCAACDRACEERAYGTGYPRARVMLVGEHPTVADLASGGAFTDEAEALEKAFDALGIGLASIYGATAVRCGAAAATPQQVEACSEHLLGEIEAVEPGVVVAFGARAASALRALDGRCGLRVPGDLAQGAPARMRPGLSALVTEPLPQGLTQKEAKRRLWRDLQTIPGLLASVGG